MGRALRRGSDPLPLVQVARLVAKAAGLPEKDVSEIDFDVYVHSSKDMLYEEGERLGMTRDALMLFRHLASEVRLTYRVNTETGEGVLLFVDGRSIV